MAHKTQEELLAADRHSLRFPHRVWAVPGGGFQHSSWYGGVQYVRDDVHATALAEAADTIARQQALLDRALEDNGGLMIEKARLEAERADLAFMGRTLQGWTLHDVLVNHEGAFQAISIMAERLSALSPGKGE